MENIWVVWRLKIVSIQYSQYTHVGISSDHAYQQNSQEKCQPSAVSSWELYCSQSRLINVMHGGSWESATNDHLFDKEDCRTGILTNILVGSAKQ